MKKLTILGIAALATLAVLAGCDKKPEETTTPTPSATTSASAAPQATAAVADAAAATAVTTTAVDPDDDIADEEDYGSEVDATITEANFESELDKLEKELK